MYVIEEFIWPIALQIHPENRSHFCCQWAQIQRTSVLQFQFGDLDLIYNILPYTTVDSKPLEFCLLYDFVIIINVGLKSLLIVQDNNEFAFQKIDDFLVAMA